MKLFLAAVVCRLLRFIGKLVGKGSSLPGKYALKICPDVLGRVMQAAAAHARRAADTAPSFETICRESEAAYAARNPHKKKEDA